MKKDPKIIENHPFIALTVAAFAGAACSGLVLKALNPKKRDYGYDVDSLNKTFEN